MRNIKLLLVSCAITLVVLVILLFTSVFFDKNPSEKNVPFNSIVVEGTAKDSFDFTNILDELEITTATAEDQIKIHIKKALPDAYTGVDSDFIEEHFIISSVHIDLQAKVLTVTIDVKTFTLEVWNNNDVDITSHFALSFSFTTSNEQIINQINEAAAEVEVGGFSIISSLEDISITIDRVTGIIRVTVITRTFAVEVWDNNDVDITSDFVLSFDFTTSNEQLITQIKEVVAEVAVEGFSIFETLEDSDITIDRVTGIIRVTVITRTFAVEVWDNNDVDITSDFVLSFDFTISNEQLITQIKEAVAEVEVDGFSIFETLEDSDITIDRVTGIIRVTVITRTFAVEVWDNNDVDITSDFVLSFDFTTSNEQLITQIKEAVAEVEVDGFSIFETLEDSDITIDRANGIIRVTVITRTFAVEVWDNNDVDITSDFVLSFDFTTSNEQLITRIKEVVAEVAVEGFSIFETLEDSDITIDRVTGIIRVTVIVRTFTIQVNDEQLTQEYDVSIDEVVRTTIRTKIAELELEFDFRTTNYELTRQVGTLIKSIGREHGGEGYFSSIVIDILRETEVIFIEMLYLNEFDIEIDLSLTDIDFYNFLKSVSFYLIQTDEELRTTINNLLSDSMPLYKVYMLDANRTTGILYVNREKV